MERHAHIHFFSIKMRKSKKTKNIEQFIEDQMEEYIRIHKEHEKDIDYIG